VLEREQVGGYEIPVDPMDFLQCDSCHRLVNVVYICRDGDNEELRYSLRSVSKNLKFRNVWVVGGKPDWYTGNYINRAQSGNKYANARNNLKAVVDCGDITDEFVLMNDDFYVMSPVEVVPYFHGGDLMDKIRVFEGFAAKSRYVQMLWDTLHILASKGSPTALDYALHVPMRLRRSELGPMLNHEASIRTLYGNLKEVGGTQIVDVKVHTRPNGPPQHDFMLSTFPFLSTSDRTYGMVRSQLLRHRFGEVSPYEL
jgi:hypothetical protein